MIKPTVLITGAAGFIGFHLTRLFLAQDIHVLGIDNLNDYYDVNLKLDRLNELGISVDVSQTEKVFSSQDNTFSFIKGSIENKELWDFIADGYDITDVIHLAAQAGVRYSIENPRVYIQSNINGFLEVLEFCRNQKIGKLIYASSSSVYGENSEQPFSETERCDEPVSLYAATKRSNELMAKTYQHLYGIESIGLRFFTVYGPWGRPDMAPFLFTNAAVAKKSIKVFNNGNQRRDFTFVSDIVDGIFKIHLQKEKIKGASICNIGNGRPINLMDFIAEIENATGQEIAKEYLPAQPGDVTETYADTTKLTRVFGYEPKITIKEGVSLFYNWFEAYYAKTRQ